jgi:CBS domain containing-hemolysin-like protein
MALLLLILLCYFLCLQAERALAGLSPHDIDALRFEEGQAAKNVLALSGAIRPALGILLLARIFFVVAAGVLAADVLFSWSWLRRQIDNLPEEFGISIQWGWNFLAFFCAVLLGLTFWGMQKITSRRKKEGEAVGVLKRLWWWVFVLQKVLRPISTLEKKANVTRQNNHSADDLSEAAHAASEKRELELLKSIVQFSDVTVKQVMQPRSKVVFAGFRANFHELLEIVRKAEFSRLPVCDEDLDNITGILYVKDLLPHLDKEHDFEWQRIIRTNVLMVPEAKRGSELLQEFKLQRMHMAIVVDEYGGMAGIVTLEDILEEVTGDIRDEFDEESEIRYLKLDDFNYLFEGQTLLNDVCRITGLASGTFDEIKGNADTLAGLALEIRGDIPSSGARITWNGFVLTITKADKRRIEQVKVTLPQLRIP